MGKCCSCGREMFSGIQLHVPKVFFQDGIYPMCKDCVAKMYAYVTEKTGNRKWAAQAICAAMDTAYVPGLLNDTGDAGADFTRYLHEVYYGVGGRFMNGNTRTAWADDDKPAAVTGRKPKKQTLESKWGAGLTDAEYAVLEEKYETEAHEYKDSITPRIEKNLITLSKLDVDLDAAIAKGDFDTANRITDIIRKTREMESLRASDERPNETARADALVNALEANGAMTDGRLKSYDELLKLIGEARGHYEHSLDIVDSVMMAVTNSMRMTAGERPVRELPPEMQVEDTKGELEKKITPLEAETLKGLNKMPVQRARKEE